MGNNTTQFSNKKDKTLLLIDTFYFMHRSFHAYPLDLMTSAGEVTNMSYGFAQSLIDSISELNPTHIACGWESEELPSFRKELFPEYQANRIPGDPEEEKLFNDQIPRIIEILDAFNIPRLTQNGFEGDDVLGTVATLGAPDANVIISTADQDLLQLITDSIFVFRPGRPPYIKKQLFDADTFIKKYGFEPHLMIDYKALRGDPSDNIPGVKGVGDKTAKDLIDAYGTIDSIYEHIDDIEKGAVKKKLESDKENAFLSRQLATIITNIPMDFDLSACEVHDFNMNKVRAIFDELEFGSLQGRLKKLEVLRNIKENFEDKDVSEEDDQLAMFA